MTKAIYNIIRFMTIVLVGINSISLIAQSYYLRVFIMVFASFLFLANVNLYEKKVKSVSPSLIFYVIVCFFNMTFCPFIYTNEKLDELRAQRPETSVTPNDHFEIYAIVSIVLSILIFIYLKTRKEEESGDVKPLYTSSTNDYAVLLSTIVLAGIGLVMNSPSFVPICVAPMTYFVASYFANRRHGNIAMFVGFVICFGYMVINALGDRFQLLQYVFPLLLFFIIYLSNNKKVKPSHVYILFIIGVLLIELYGVVSEVYKLNHGYGMSISLSDVFNNKDVLFKYMENQIYRIFEIWTPLGGTIIELVQENGYYYGLTFIKSIAPRLGLEYVNLATINAQFIGATYAQPGLVAEGYANFGIIGAIVNLGIIFVLMEYCYRKYLKEKTPYMLLFAIVPFSKIILDGGSLNDAIFNIIFVFITIFFIKILPIDNRQVALNKSLAKSI